MKRIVTIFILLTWVSMSSIALATTNTPKNTKKKDAAVSLNEQIDVLNVRIDSLNTVYQKKIDEVYCTSKENCTIYYDRLDAEFDRTLVLLSLIWGLFGVIIGIVVPIILNRTYERNLKQQIEETKKNTTQQINDLLVNISYKNKQLERLTIGRMRDKYNDIDKQLATLTQETTSLKQLKIQLDDVRAKVETSERNAKQSQANAMISRLYSEASKEYQNNPQRAIDLYTRIISLNEKEFEAYNNRAILYLQREEYEQTINDTTKAITINNAVAYAYAVRGVAKNKLKRFENAIDDFSKALQYCKDDKHRNQIYLDRAESYFGLEQFDKTVEDYDSADKIFPLDANNLNNRANVYLKLRKFDIALLDAFDALKLCKDDQLKSCIYDTLGCIYVAKEMYQEALENFNKAIDLNAQLWECYENRANVYQILLSQTEDNREKTKLQNMYKADIQIFRTKKIVENEKTLE